MPSSFNTALAALIIGILSTVTVAQPLPVHEYRLDGNALDSAGVAHGVVGNQLPFISYGVPQALDQAIRFTTDGTPPNRTVIVPKESVTDINDNDFAFAFYVRQQQINDGDVRAIADTYGNPSAPNPIGWSIYFSASGSLHIRFRDNTGFSRTIKTNTQIVDTDWHYVVFSCDRGDVLGAKWYIDGTLDSEEIPITWWALFTMEQDLRLGSMEYFPNRLGWRSRPVPNLSRCPNAK